MLCHDHTPGFVHKLKPFFQNKVLSSHHSYMTKKLINRWNERPSAFLQNPCASDLKLNKCALPDAIFVFFRTQTSLSYNSSSLIAHRLPKLCLRGRWWLWKGIPGKYVVFIDFFLLKCPVKSGPVLSNAKVSPVSPPLNSPAWWRTMQVYRWEQLPKRSLRLFSLQKTGK